jgi:hypothetical protein
VAAALVLLVLAPSVASAQRTVTLEIAGNAATQNPTLADYDAGFVTDATPLTWTATINGPRNNCTYNTTVQMRAMSASIGNGKSIADVLWSDGGPFTPLTTSYVTVGTAALTRNNRSESGSLIFRIQLAWTEESPDFDGTSLQFQVTTTSTGRGCD